MTNEELIALRVKVEQGQAAEAELARIAAGAENVGDKADKASKKSEKAATRWERTRKTLGRVAKVAAATGGALAAIGGATIKNAIDRTEDMAKSTLGFSKVTDLSVKSSAEWVEMAKLRGVDSKALSMGIVQLSKNQQAGLKHGTAQQKMFKQLGITQEQLRKTSPADMFGLIGDKLKGLKKPSERNALGVGLMGRSYLRLASLVLGGSDALKQNLQDVEGVGNAMGAVSRDQLVEYIKTSRKADANMDAFHITLGLKVMPILDKFIQKMTSVITWMTKHKTATGILLTAIAVLGTAYIVLNGIMAIAAAMGVAVSASWLLIPLAIIVVIGAFVYLYLKVKWFRNAVNAVLGFIKKHWKLVLLGLVAPLALIAVLIVKYWSKIVRFVKSVPGKLAKAGSGMWDWIKSTFKSALNWVITKWNNFHIAMKPVKMLGHTVVPGFDLQTPNITPLAKGGNVSGAGSFIAGEEPGVAERVDTDGRGNFRVTPLRYGNGMMPAADGPVIEFDQPIYLDGELVGRNVGRHVARRKARTQGV